MTNWNSLDKLIWSLPSLPQSDPSESDNKTIPASLSPSIIESIPFEPHSEDYSLRRMESHCMTWGGNLLR